MSAKKVSELERRFAEKLRKELDMRRHGMQTELAEILGCTKSKVNSIVTGRRGSDEETRRAICGHLGLDYESFVFGDDGGNTQVVGSAEGAVAQTMGGGSVNITTTGGNSKLSEREEELIELLRRYGGDGAIDDIIRKLKQVKNMFS